MPFDLVWRDEAPAPALSAFLEAARAVTAKAPWVRQRAAVMLGSET